MPRPVRLPVPLFRIRLARFMEARSLDEHALAARSGVSLDVVQGLVSGRRTTASPRTLERLARSLGTTRDELLGAAQDDSGGNVHPLAGQRGPRPARRTALLIAAFMAAAGAAVLLWREIRPHQYTLEFTPDDRYFVVKEAGRERWREDCSTTIGFAVARRWGDHDEVIYGTRATDAEGGVLFAKELATGDSLWTHRPGIEYMRGWYRDDLIESGRFQPDASFTAFDARNMLCFADIDADGYDDMVIRWQWIPWYPTLVAWYSGRDWPARGDDALHVYRTSGRVSFVHAVNIDDDAQMEIILTGTNNAPAHQGAMISILDDTHWSGASVDSFSALTQWAEADSAWDGCLVRIVLPAFEPEFMHAFGMSRLDAASMAVTTDGRGRPHLLLGIGEGKDPFLLIRFDADLEPIAFEIRPAAERLVVASPHVARRFDAEYVRGWLERRRLFRGRALGGSL